MDLAAWLKLPEHSKNGLARKAGVCWQTINRVSKGGPCRPDTAKKIEAATDGQVSAATILGVAA